MARGTLIVFTNPSSEDRESEFNDWYNNIHAKEVLALPGFSGITRLRVGPEVRGSFPHGYLALYDCHDVALAHSELIAAQPHLNISDSLADTAVAVFFEETFSLRAQDLDSKKV